MVECPTTDLKVVVWIPAALILDFMSFSAHIHGHEYWSICHPSKQSSRVTLLSCKNLFTIEVKYIGINHINNVYVFIRPTLKIVGQQYSCRYIFELGRQSQTKGPQRFYFLQLNQLTIIFNNICRYFDSSINVLHNYRENSRQIRMCCTFFV